MLIRICIRIAGNCKAITGRCCGCGSSGAGSSGGYLPLNAFDSYIDNDNPYLKLNDTGEVKDSVLAFTLRSFTYLLSSLIPKKVNTNELTNTILNGSEFTNFNNEEISLVAKAESQLLFNSLLFDEKGENKIIDYLIFELGGNPDIFYDNIKDIMTTPNFINSEIFNEPILEFKTAEDGTKFFVYQLLTDKQHNTYQYLPFSDDLRSKTIIKNFNNFEYDSDNASYLNLLSETNINGFEIVDVDTIDGITYNYPQLPDNPKKQEGEEDLPQSNNAKVKIVEDTYYGKYISEDKFTFNFGNDESSNETTIFGGDSSSLKFRVINNFYSDDEQWWIFNDINKSNLSLLFYYNTNLDTFRRYGHMTGIPLQLSDELSDEYVNVKQSEFNEIAYDRNHTEDSDDENVRTFSWFDEYYTSNISEKLGNLQNEQYSLDNIWFSNIFVGENSLELTKPISLFGSEFYNKQTSNRAKSLLYLNSLPYRVGEDLDILISALLNRQSSIIKVPKMLMVLIGGMLWRTTQNEDPIMFYKNSDGNLTNSTTSSTDVCAITNGINILKPELDEFLITTAYPNNYVSSTENSQNNSDDYLYFMTLIDSNRRSNPKYKFKELEYVKLPSSVTTMSNELKQKFINEYESWLGNINTGWGKIKNDWELSKKNNSSSWEDSVTRTSGNELVNDNYQVISYITSDELNTYNVDNFNVLAVCKPITETVNINNIDTANPQITTVINSLLESKYIVNSTPQVWNTDKSNEKYFNNIIKETNVFETYVKTFYSELARLNNLKNEAEKTRKNNTSNILNGKDVDNLKLNIYRNIKAIHDKWLGDEDLPYGVCGGVNNLFESFRIIDKHYNNIGDKVVVDPKALSNNIIGKPNSSLSNLLSEFLCSMNFDFIALPNFVNLNDKKEIKQMFNAFNYVENAPTEGPTFICMYVGDRSKNLDLGKDNLKDDGTDIRVSEKFGDSNLDLNGSGFVIKYGQQNQSIFKDLELNQKEFSETDESLYITDALSNPNSVKNGSFIGQSLFNIYTTRSYNCGVSMMGNAMVQPMTYFQLDNIPMFKGAYLIKSVKHSIKPNTMETQITGTRISNNQPPLIEEGVVYLNMLGSLKNMTKDGTTLTGDIDRTNIGSTITYSDNQNVSGVQSLESFNEDTPDIDENNNNGIIYV